MNRRLEGKKSLLELLHEISIQSECKSLTAWNSNTSSSDHRNWESSSPRGNLGLMWGLSQKDESTNTSLGEEVGPPGGAPGLGRTGCFSIIRYDITSFRHLSSLNQSKSKMPMGFSFRNRTLQSCSRVAYYSAWYFCPIMLPSWIFLHRTLSWMTAVKSSTARTWTVKPGSLPP